MIQSNHISATLSLKVSNIVSSLKVTTGSPLGNFPISGLDGMPCSR